MLPEWLLGMVAGAVGSLLMWFVIGPVMSGKGLERWIKAAQTDPDKRETLYILFDEILTYASTRPIKTGKKIKTATDEQDDQGNPLYVDVDEVLTPIQLMARTVGDFVIMKVKGMSGGVKSQLGRVIREEAAESGLGLSPAAIGALAKGKIGPAVAELGMPFLMKKLNKSGDNTSSGGTEKW